ncbi:MAG: hypothetical protein EHM14_05370 [Methanothrix sp.]|nr:MAG: hypothetical protein EHM14_05370 [Methanothrix sp.]
MWLMDLARTLLMHRFVFACIVLSLIAQGAYAEGAFSAGDRVWTTDILHVRDAPGTSSSEIGSIIKGSVGTVIIGGPVFKEEYNWWNISYDAGTTGWSAENWLQKDPIEPQQPGDFAIWSEDAIKWGENHTGSKDWWDEINKQGYCLRFVANAFMQKYLEGQSVWNSPIEAAAALYRFNQEPGGWANAPRGAIILFDKEGGNSYGHVGIYLGAGRILHAHGTVQDTTVEDAMAYSDVGNYLGWSYPPEAWRPKTSTTSQPVEKAERTQEPSNAIDQDTSCLATALMSESSVGTVEERAAVAWTVFNRVNSPNFPNTICGVVNQRGQYAMNQKPNQEFLDLAASLIAEPGADPTGGATYFFSPISMPKEGKATGGYDIGGGLHEVEGISGKVYFPSWALTMESAGDITGVRPAYYMFYRERAASEEVTLTLYVHDGSADGPKLSGAEVIGHDAVGKSFSQITDANGFVVITGSPGSWQFTATKPGYDANSWPQEIIKTGTKHAYLFAEKMPTKSVTENRIQSTTQNVSSGSETSVDGELGDLINALKDKDAGVRLKAAEALGKLADARAVDPLIEALRYDENNDVREMAAWALGQIDDARTVDPLSYTSVKDAGYDVREEAYNALQKNTVGGSKIDARSADPIIGALKDEDQGVRYRAAEALGQLKNATSVDSLIEALKDDENGDVREMAAWALGQIDDVRTVAPLSYASVKDAGYDVREEAYNALQKNIVGGNKVDARSADPIIGALKDEDQGVRYRAAEALGQLKNATSVDSLIEALKDDEDGDVREMAAWALGQIGDVRAVDPLSYASVKDADYDVREEAKKALGKLGVQAE